MAPAEARVVVGHRRRATTTVALVTLLSAAALLTTSWTASSLLPAQSYRCRTLLPALVPLARLTCAASRVRRGRSAADAAAAEEAVPTELVAESFLLRQLARAYLAAPWALPGGVGRGRTPREQPPGGWPFPVGLGSDDAAEEGEPRRAGALNLSESASAVLAQRGERGPSTRSGLGLVYS